MLKKLDTMTEAVLGMPVRIGGPEGIGGLKNMVAEPMYATGVGLVMYSLEHHNERMIYVDLFGEILIRMRKWVKGLFRRNTKHDNGSGLRHRLTASNKGNEREWFY